MFALDFWKYSGAMCFLWAFVPNAWKYRNCATCTVSVQMECFPLCSIIRLEMGMFTKYYTMFNSNQNTSINGVINTCIQQDLDKWWSVHSITITHVHDIQQRLPNIPTSSIHYGPQYGHRWQETQVYWLRERTGIWVSYGEWHDLAPLFTIRSVQLMMEYPPIA